MAKYTEEEFDEALKRILGSLTFKHMKSKIKLGEYAIQELFLKNLENSSKQYKKDSDIIRAVMNEFNLIGVFNFKKKS